MMSHFKICHQNSKILIRENSELIITKILEVVTLEIDHNNLSFNQAETIIKIQ
jgi:hypothetical protein